MALLSIPSNACLSAPTCLSGKGRLLLSNRRPGPVTCKIGKIEDVQPKTSFGRTSFPTGFTFGAATSSYQVEGGANEGGKGPSIWDTFTHLDQGEKIQDHQTGDIACDSYHKYKTDVELLKEMGMDAYRFSIAWSRILPKGDIEGGISQEGIDYYNNLINELIKNGITPFVTIFHWDVPQALEDEYGGFLDHKIVGDFKDYCEVCFKEFGDRVKHWITLNEPWTFSSYAYGRGIHAPGRCSEEMGCTAGDSLTEPYIVGHNLLLAHAAAYRLYEEKFKVTQKGEVGITLVTHWFKEYSESRPDIVAAIRAFDFMLGWYMEPLAFGDYPFTMKALLKERLPSFTKEEAEMIQGSYDFLGMNYYTARYARNIPFSENFHPVSNPQDSYVEGLTEKDNVPIGKLEGIFHVYPEGVKDVLMEISRRYNHPKIYITETGTCEPDNPENSLALGEALDDEQRIAYYSNHLANVQEAIRNGANVKGFFAWSLMDSFEWNSGYTLRFGLTYVDFKNNLKRHPKNSSKWFRKFLKS